MFNRLQKFFQLEASGGVLLFVFAFLALIFANTDLSQLYFSFLDTPVRVQIGALDIHKPLLLWINDGLMACFFVLVGMEVKHELFEGSLSSYQQAIFPAIAALGGMIVPAIVYTFIAQNYAELQSGWAIPMATDIAFAIGIVALLGARVPFALKMFLLALAIIDDLGAIVVIALFYSSELSVPALVIASLAIVGLFIANRLKASALSIYMVLGVILWASVLKSGVHATLAGVIIGFSVPLKDKQGESPLHHFAEMLEPWCKFIVLPLFAFANAGVFIGNLTVTDIFSPLPLAISLGLLLGKTVGVFSFSWLSVKLRLAKLPEGVNFKQIFAIAVLCGIGFTMSMFLAGLAFGEGEERIIALSRLGILLGSFVSALLGYLLLKKSTANIAPEAR